MVAVSRLFLDNIQHIQASWLTQGLKLGQTALRFGADDMGSIMIEENVVSAAGANTCANERDLRYQIREAGFIPQQRDILYNYVDRPDVDLDSDDSLNLKQLSVAFAD
jgi:cyclic dehypoxanthinyl futalosine synthase